MTENDLKLLEKRVAKAQSDVDNLQAEIESKQKTLARIESTVRDIFPDLVFDDLEEVNFQELAEELEDELQSCLSGIETKLAKVEGGVRELNTAVEQSRK